MRPYTREDFNRTRNNNLAESRSLYRAYRILGESKDPEDIDKNEGGNHNGDNYIAYTYYIENEGKESVNYWYKILIDDVILNVDEAIRFRVYFDGEPTVYAKKGINGKPEEGTVAFKDDESVFMHKVENFSPGEIHQYTVVMWVEGNDLECTNNILGGELKVHYDFKSYHKESRE